VGRIAGDFQGAVGGEDLNAPKSNELATNTLQVRCLTLIVNRVLQYSFSAGTQRTAACVAMGHAAGFLTAVHTPPTYLQLRMHQWRVPTKACCPGCGYWFWFWGSIGYGITCCRLQAGV
jgi:hypothetical protein